MCCANRHSATALFLLGTLHGRWRCSPWGVSLSPREQHAVVLSIFDEEHTLDANKGSSETCARLILLTPSLGKTQLLPPARREGGLQDNRKWECLLFGSRTQPNPDDPLMCSTLYRTDISLADAQPARSSATVISQSLRGNFRIPLHASS
jgi:hypothetical protein